MNSISIRWERRAVNETAALPKEGRRRVVEAVEGLRVNPMLGRQLSSQWKGLRRLRVGKYGVIYGFDGKELQISVVRVAHRRAVYR